MTPFSTKYQFLLFTSIFQTLLKVFQDLWTPIFTSTFYTETGEATVCNCLHTQTGKVRAIIINQREANFLLMMPL